MKSRIAVIYYSSYGHTHQMAEVVAAGARETGAVVRLRRVAELPDAEKAMSSQDAYVEAQQKQEHVQVATLDDLRWSDGVIWGIPTRYGNMPAQVKQFIDTTGPLWQSGEMEDKGTGIFTSTATIHGGQESTILTSLVPLLHLGMVFVGTPYGQNPQIMTTDGVGGSPYGPGTLAGSDGARQPVEEELETARRLGARVAEVSALLRPMRERKRAQGGTDQQEKEQTRAGRAA